MAPLFSGWNPSRPSPDDPVEVAPARVREMMDDGDPLLVIDCRQPDEYAVCHLPAAVLIPLARLPGDLLAREPDRDARIVVYCHHGMRSLRATRLMQAVGYRHVASMAGGVERWASDIDPTMARY